MEKIILKGVPVYTSDELKEKLKDILFKYGSPSSKDILIKLVDNGILIPVINESSELKKLIMKIKGKKILNKILGTLSNGKAYVIFHPSKGFPPLKEYVPKTCIHEIIHLSYMQSPNEFSKINIPLFVRFYSTFFKDLLESKQYNKDFFLRFIEKLIKDEKNRMFDWKSYSYLYKAFSKYSVLPKERFDHRFEEVWEVIDKTWEGKDIHHYNIVLALLRKTYRILFENFEYNTLVGQELYFPSEIISVLATINSDHPNVIRSIKLIEPGKPIVIKSLAKKLISH